MNRMHLFEVVDLPYCPPVVRDGVTDWIAFMLNSHKGFNNLAPRLLNVLKRVNANQVIDLCSGGGGPWLTLEREIARSMEVKVLLTDLYPNNGCYELLGDSSGAFELHREPVDATQVPEGLNGVRTVISAFHHFRPNDAQRILTDAVRKRQAIVVFEGSDSRWRGLAIMTLMPILMFAFMPLVRPFRWSRLLLTYVIPVLPLIGIWDGSVSMLRTYSPAEMRELIAGVENHQSFDWAVGTQPVPGSPLGLTYLVGTPAKETA